VPCPGLQGLVLGAARADDRLHEPPQPYASGLVPSHPAPGPHTFALEGSVNGVTTETCHFENIDFHAIVVR
jgi:hypothetical protein